MIDLLGEEIGKALSSKLLEPILNVRGSTTRRFHVLAPIYVRPPTHTTVALFTLSHSVRHAPRRTSRSRVVAYLYVLIQTILLCQPCVRVFLYGVVIWPELLWRMMEVMACNLRVRGRPSWTDTQRRPTSAGECFSPPPALCWRVPP